MSYGEKYSDNELAIQQELSDQLMVQAVGAYLAGDAETFRFASGVYDETQARLRELAPWDQERLTATIQKLERIVQSPIVTTVLDTTGPTPGIGWGLREYRAGKDFLGSAPQQEGDSPAEITYYPVVPEIDVDGAIYWHGPKSKALDKGRLASFHFDDTLEGGMYVNHLEIQLRDGQLHIGRPQSDTLAPAEPEVLRAAEISIDTLLEYIENQETKSLEATPSR